MTTVPTASPLGFNGANAQNLTQEEKFAEESFSLPLKRSAEFAMVETEVTLNENSSRHPLSSPEENSIKFSSEIKIATSMQPQIKKQAVSHVAQNATEEMNEDVTQKGAANITESCKGVEAVNGVDKVGDAFVEQTKDFSLYATIRKQIEYYFSNDNMKYDKFFRDLMENPSIAEFKGWLPMNVIMSCPRIKTLNCTQEMILAALETSSLSKRKDTSGEYWFRRDAPLPALQERTTANRHHIKKPKPLVSYHSAGCLAKIVDIPEEIGSWVVVKDAIKESLPKNAILKFISPVESKGVCKLWIKPFPNDVETIPALTVTLNGASLKLVLMEDENEIRHFLNTELPGRMRREREKLLIRQRNQRMQQACSLAGQTFDNFDHLKMCVAELLEKTEENTQFKANSTAEKVICAILKYHPSYEFKKGGPDAEITGIKVIAAPENYRKKGKKCFAMLKRANPSADIIEEPFRMDKCLSELSRSLPVATASLSVDAAAANPAVSDEA